MTTSKFDFILYGKTLKSVEWIVLAKLSSQLLSILTYILGLPGMEDVGFMSLTKVLTL